MNKLGAFGVLTGGLCLFSYLLGAFVGVSFNPVDWSENLRLFVAFGFVGSLGFGLIELSRGKE